MSLRRSVPRQSDPDTLTSLYLATMQKIMGFSESEYLRINFDTGNTYRRE
jgi:hypothetical protein